VPPATRSDAKASVSAVAESGASTTTAAGAQQEASREAAEKRGEEHRGRDPELRISESDRRDQRPESRAEPPALPGKPDVEAAPVGSEARNGEATTATKRWAIWICLFIYYCWCCDKHYCLWIVPIWVSIFTISCELLFFQ
jgi:hypothetical protein